MSVTYYLRDVNFSKLVDIIDFMLIINFITRESQAASIQFNLAYINGENNIDIPDVANLINVILQD
tara:strand:- start:33 stop:230 length:198 start_codon:yes stop_codon:yes gene_type:complete